MNSLRRKLSANGCYDFFRRLDLDPEILFYSDMDIGNPYTDHEWVLKENDDFIIINAIPPLEKQNRLFWEEWFLHKGEIYHHVLTLWRPSRYDEIFECPDRDEIHPELSFGKTWYVQDEKDMTPMLLRR